MIFDLSADGTATAAVTVIRYSPTAAANTVTTTGPAPALERREVIIIRRRPDPLPEEAPPPEPELPRVIYSPHRVEMTPVRHVPPRVVSRSWGVRLRERCKWV